jgi:hypothetical protein
MRGTHGLAYALLMLAALGCVCGRGFNPKRASPSDGSSPEPSTVIKVSPQSLLSEYEKDEPAADLKYQGKTLQVLGKASGPYKDKNRVQIGDPTRYVVCHYDEAREYSFSGMKHGLLAEVRGVCKGLKVEGSYTSVLLEDCHLVWNESSGSKQMDPGKFPKRFP